MSQRETNIRLRDPITVRSTSSGLSICYYCSFGVFWIIFYPSPHYKALLFYLIISPVPTCLVHNCETSQRFAIPICCHPCLKIKFPLISITGHLPHSIPLCHIMGTSNTWQWLLARAIPVLTTLHLVVLLDHSTIPPSSLMSPTNTSSTLLAALFPL